MASRSAVSTLHARLNLPSSFSHSTLKRCLVDKTASKEFNNASLAVHGNHILGYYITNYITTRYPRLPYRATKNVLVSYGGWKTLASIGRGWGVEGVPREEITLASRTFKTTRPGTAPSADELSSMLQLNRVDHGQTKDGKTEGEAAVQYIDQAYADFVRSVVAGMHLHAGAAAVRQFIDQHFFSREVDLIRSFRILQPQRELSALCAREGLERPITRLIAETGRRSNSPVFIVGVYSGAEKLGEGQASSLKEAEYTAQSNAMKAWYLFQDKNATLPGLTMEEGWAGKEFKPSMIDTGDIIV